MTETPAGRLARTMPEMGNHELSALMWEASEPEQAIRERCEDAEIARNGGLV